MLHFDSNSWHYRLVWYVFGKNFFIEIGDLDFKAMESQYNPQTKTEDYKLIFKTKPKVINFCPYCRGVLWSALSLPFVYIWRLLPHKGKKVMTHADTMKRLKRRGFIMRTFGSSVLFMIGVVNILLGDYALGIFDMIVGLVIIFLLGILPGYPKQTNKFLISPMKKVLVPIFKPLVKFIIKHWPKGKEKEKEKIVKVKNPSIVKAYLHTKHSLICPPVCFIDKVDEAKLR